MYTKGINSQKNKASKREKGGDGNPENRGNHGKLGISAGKGENHQICEPGNGGKRG